MVVVIPDKLPCSESSSFVVSFNDPLPKDQDDFILIFKGLESGRKSHGHAKRVDNQTLIATTGEHDVAETVKVSVTATRSAKIKPFQMTFLTPFQMVCRLLPDVGAVHSASALARCLQLPHDNTSVSVLDDELTAICERTAVPDDLTFKSFFGAGCRDTLLHFAAEKGLQKFAAHLLGKSSDACSAFRLLNDDDLTPKDIANELTNGDDIRQVFQEFEENAPIDNVPLIQAASRRPMRKNRSFLANVIDEPPKQDKEIDKLKSRRSLFKRWMPKLKGGEKKPSKHNKSNEQKPSVSSLRQSIANKIPMTPPPMARSSIGASAAQSDPEDDDIEYSHSESDDASGDENHLVDHSTQNRPHKDVILPPHQLHSFIGKAIVKKTYTPGIYDPSDSLAVQAGELLDIIEVAGAWMSVASKGREGRVMMSSVDMQLFGDDVPDYEDVDVDPAGVKIEDHEVPDYQPPIDQRSVVGDNNTYVAQYGWVPQQANQLRFNADDDIYIVEQNQHGWWLGYIEGKPDVQGLVPSTYLAKKVSGETNGGGSNQSGSSSSGVSSAAVSSRVSPYSFASSQTSAGSDVSSVSGSSLGGEQHDRTTPAWQTRFQQTITCSRSVSAKQQTIPGRLKMQTVQGSENGKDKPAQPRLSQVDGPQSKSNPNSPPLKQQRPRPAVSDRKDDFLLSPKPSLPARIQRSDKKERPTSALSSPLPSRRGNNPTGSFTDMQKKFERGPHLEDTHTSKCGAPNLRPLVLNPKTPENPITEKSSSLLSSPLFKRRAAAVSSTAQHKEEKGRCKDESAATQPSLSSKQPANHEQKWRAIYNYTAADDSELSLKVGDVINVYMEGSGNGWFSASLRGNKGYVPANYVERI